MRILYTPPIDVYMRGRAVTGHGCVACFRPHIACLGRLPAHESVSERLPTVQGSRSAAHCAARSRRTRLDGKGESALWTCCARAGYRRGTRVEWPTVRFERNRCQLGRLAHVLDHLRIERGLGARTANLGGRIERDAQGQGAQGTSEFKHLSCLLCRIQSRQSSPTNPPTRKPLFVSFVNTTCYRILCRCCALRVDLPTSATAQTRSCGTFVMRGQHGSSYARSGKLNRTFYRTSRRLEGSPRPPAASTTVRVSGHVWRPGLLTKGVRRVRLGVREDRAPIRGRAEQQAAADDCVRASKVTADQGVISGL